MPSPIGHALAGYAAGTLVAGRPSGRGISGLDTILGRVLLFAGLACIPDIDFLFHSHSMYTHSVGAVLIVTMVAALLIRRPSIVAACAAAYASHLLLDWLGRDTNPPLGIMALWPFSRAYYMAPVPIIEPVSRNFHWAYFWSHNLKVVGIEILIFGTLALAAHRWRGGVQGAGKV